MKRRLTYQAGWTRYAAFLFLLSAAPACVAAAAATQAQTGGTEAEVRRADAAFWEAYNRCDEQAMAALFNKDAEFYHDKTGLNAGRAQVAASMMRGPCANPKQSRLRREAVADMIRFDPLAGGFALLSGEHRFHLTNRGEPERPSGVARFTSIWQRDGGAWRMRRIVSYAHGPDLPKLVAISVSAEALAPLAGGYAGEGGATAHVRVDAGMLTLASGGAEFKLVPIGPGRFGVADRPVQFLFAGETAAVVENGATVANMRRVK